MTYYQPPEGYCPITGFTFFDTPKDAGRYKKNKQNYYRRKKAKQAVVVAMYDPEVKAIICQ